MLGLGKDVRRQQRSRARSHGSCFPGIGRCLHSPVGSRREGPGIAGLGTGGPLHDAGKLVMLVVRRDGTKTKFSGSSAGLVPRSGWAICGLGAVAALS